MMTRTLTTTSYIPGIDDFGESKRSVESGETRERRGEKFLLGSGTWYLKAGP
jgi:hypothetical protein